MAKPLMKKLLLVAVLFAANATLAASARASEDGWFDKCKYGIPPWGSRCTEYCSDDWGGCGGSPCETEDGCSYGQN